ncbi:MAG TPA: DUF6270 domain-containing protein [Prolixibacteraceae bacterium]|nr:DUF6270 domain-containing protein [Prolixibacteraceae bacterium]
MNILIFGSCVTRDAFDIGNYKNDDLAHIHYFARNSLISLNSPPFNIDVNDIHDVNLFQQRLIANEMNRTFYSHISTRDLKETYLIIDFIDERLDLLLYDDKYLTCSLEFENSNLSKSMKGQRIKRSVSLVENLWKRNCILFIEKIKRFFPPEKIILHKAFWSEKFLNNRESHEFADIRQVRDNNEQLSIYYSFFQMNFPEIKVIDLTHRGYYADKNHKWGFNPAHYENEYYFQFLVELDRILNQND